MDTPATGAAADLHGAAIAGALSVLDALPWLAELREDERRRATARFHMGALRAGERHVAAAPPVLGVVLSGVVTVTRAVPGQAPAPVRLGPGDRWGEVAVFAGLAEETTVAAETAAVIAWLDHEAFLALVAEAPIVWLAVAERLSRELKTTSDLLREIREVEASELGAASLARFLATKRRQVGRHAGIARSATSALFRRLVSAHLREPAFWVLMGFVGAIAVSRLVVGIILGFGLQEQLFNLRESGGANPLHVHHFNYGFVVLVIAGLLAFFPRSRRMLRTLATVFGIGLGLVFDEFALIWNLDPDYYQSLSYQAQAVLAALLIQLVYFRRVYAEFAARVAARFGRRA